MRSIPTNNEICALAAVWLIWATLKYIGTALLGVMGEYGATLPLPTRLGIIVLSSNAYCLPSLIGTLIIIAISRARLANDRKQLGLHYMTLASFAFTVIVLLCLIPLIHLKT